MAETETKEKPPEAKEAPLQPPSMMDRHPLGIGDIVDRMLAVEAHVRDLNDRLAVLEPDDPAAGPPAVVTNPYVQGSGHVGEELTSTMGTWTNEPTSYAYQWGEMVDGTGEPISGATSNAYTPTSDMNGKSVYCAVTASNAAGAGEAAGSNAVAVSAPSRSRR